MIYLDTNIFLDIAHRTNEQFCKGSKNLLSAIHKGEASAITSVFTVHEIKWVLHKDGEYLRADDAINFIENIHNHALFPVTLEIANFSADLRVAYNILSHDSLHLATALTTKCESLITRDKKFKKIEDIKVLTPEEFLKLK